MGEVAAQESPVAALGITQKKGYLPGLHGLRFLAAFSVFFGHLEQAKSWVRLPYFRIRNEGTMASDGVTLFFVLSGFLITYLLLLEQRETGDVSVRNFYARRMLRIWPLYYLMLFFVFAVIPYISFLSFPVLDQTLTNNFWERLVAHLFLAPHVAFVIWTPIGVGGPLWSVGVEEWFYLVWPHLIKRLRPALPWILLGIIGLMIFLRDQGRTMSPVWQTFLFIFRIDSMAIGSLGAWCWLNKKRWVEFLVFPGVVQLTAYYLAVKHLKFYTNYGLLNTEVYSLVFLVIIMNVSLNPRSPVTLENPFFRYMGEISYGFYVFHWLVNVFCIKMLFQLPWIANEDLRNTLLLISAFTLTTALASLSYWFWERRFLRLKQWFNPSSASSGQSLGQALGSLLPGFVRGRAT